MLPGPTDQAARAMIDGAEGVAEGEGADGPADVGVFACSNAVARVPARRMCSTPMRAGLSAGS